MMDTTRRPSWWAKCLSIAVVASAAACAPERGAVERWCDLIPRPVFQTLERIPVADDWFEVHAITDGVYSISEPYQFQEVISYLILGRERALLFDTGMGISNITTVVEELTSLPVQVLNSHTHFDHVGGNADFSTILAMNTEYTRLHAERPDYRPGITRDLREEVAPAALCRPLPADVDASSYHTRPFAVTQFIEDGHLVELGDRTLEVLSIPGHTPDAIALLDRNHGLLWTGDSFYEGTIWLFVPETDLDAYAASVERLAALGPELEMLLPAHNTPRVNPVRLEELKAAFDEVRRGAVEPDRLEDGSVVYRFGNFSLLTSDTVR